MPLVRLLLVGDDHAAIDPTAAQRGDDALRDVPLAIVAPRGRNRDQCGCRQLRRVGVIALSIIHHAGVIAAPPPPSHPQLPSLGMIPIPPTLRIGMVAQPWGAKAPVGGGADRGFSISAADPMKRARARVQRAGGICYA